MEFIRLLSLILALSLSGPAALSAGFQTTCADEFAKHANKIPRRGLIHMSENAVFAPPDAAYSILGEGLFEIEFGRLIPLHPLPNPLRKPPLPEDHIETLKGELVIHGFRLDIGPPPKAFLMPDGSLVIASGHHRIRALQELGEGTAPVIVLDWNRVSRAVQEFYLVNYGEALWPHIPVPY